VAHVEKRQGRRADGSGGPVKWRARYRTALGKERSRTFSRKVDAERWLATVEASKVRGDWIDPQVQKVTIGELADRLLETKRDPNTKAWNRAMLRHVRDRWGDALVASLNHLDIQAWVADLEAARRGPDVVRGAFRVLHETVALALRARIIGHDPCLGIRLPAVRRREMLFIDPQRVDILATALDMRWPDQGHGLAVRFAAYSGCRAGEICGLRARDLDLDGLRVHVVAARKSHGADGAPKTGRSRWVDLPSQLCDELRVYLDARQIHDSDRVWTGERGGPLDHKWFYRKRFKAVVEELSARGLLPIVTGETDAGLKTYTLRFHDLRHSCVAMLIARGAQQYEVMEHLGHTNIQTTINTYGHLFPSVRVRIRAALEDSWASATSEPPAAHPRPEPQSAPAESTSATP
jgi:integrase